MAVRGLFLLFLAGTLGGVETDVSERLKQGYLARALEGFGDESQALRQELFQLGDEAAFFDKHIRPTIPSASQKQAAVVKKVRRHIPQLDPATIFFLPPGHPLHGRGEDQVLDLVDKEGRERAYAFLSGVEAPEHELIRRVVYASVLQGQISRFRLLELLEKETGIPRHHLGLAADQLRTGVAEHRMRRHLGRILVGETGYRPDMSPADAAARRATQGDIGAMTKAWSPSRKKAIALLAQHAKGLAGRPPLPRVLRIDLDLEIAKAVNPWIPYREGRARAALRVHESHARAFAESRGDENLSIDALEEQIKKEEKMP